MKLRTLNWLPEGFFADGPSRSDVSGRPTEPPGHRKSPVPLDPALKSLAAAVRAYAHPEYPFLHKDYSPSSRMPCADFTPFIVNCLQSGRLEPTQLLMMSLVSANPGVGCGPEWAAEAVTEIAALDFERYFSARSPMTYVELKALFILASLFGSGREFWLTREFDMLFAFGLSCVGIAWHPRMELLREKANSFILDMRRSTPYWEGYSLFDEGCWDVPPPDTHPADAWLNGLPLAARIHLIHFANPAYGGKGALLKSTTFLMRSLGINSCETSDILLGSRFCEAAEDPVALRDVWTKKELLALANCRGIVLPKSADKRRILAALATQVPNFVRQACREARVATLRAEFHPFLRERFEYARKLARSVALLFFVGRG